MEISNIKNVHIYQTSLFGLHRVGAIRTETASWLNNPLHSSALSPLIDTQIAGVRINKLGEEFLGGFEYSLMKIHHTTIKIYFAAVPEIGY